MVRVTGAELLRLLRAEADRVSDIAAQLREVVKRVADPTAAEAEVEALRAAAEQHALWDWARRAAGVGRLAGLAGSHPCSGRRAGSPSRDRPGPLRCGQDAGRLPR